MAVARLSPFPSLPVFSIVQSRFYAKKKKQKCGELEEFDQDGYEERMKLIVDNLKIEYASLRIGVVTPAILDPVKVDIGGHLARLTEVAQVIVKDASMLIVQPFESSHTGAIEKAIITSKLGLNPVADSRGLRVPIPKMTTEGRQAVVKKAKELQVEFSNKVRAIQREAEADVKNLSKTWSSDEIFHLKKDIEAFSKKYLNELAAALQKKTQEINRS